MPSTRSSARLADRTSSQNGESSPPAAKSPTNGSTKRKADSSPSSAKAKKGRKTDEAGQKTLEETIAGGNQEEEKDQPEDIEMKEAGNPGEGNKPKPDNRAELKAMHGGEHPGKAGHDGGPSCWFWLDNETYVKKDEVSDDSKTIKAGESWEGKNREGESKDDPEKALKDSRGGPGLNALPVDKPVVKDVPNDDVHADADKNPMLATKGGAVEDDKEREKAQPSNILEKGLIHFFTRDRVGVEDAGGVSDLQRSFFVLRPFPPGGKITAGAVEDTKNNRLLALPKKVWPKSPSDKFMAFVEKAQTTMDDLKENFFQGSEYSTKTSGVRSQHAITPVGEGVYAITKAGNRDESHLSYMTTIPKEIGELQRDIGINSKGSFVMSLKNPTAKGPANASLPEGPGFSQEILDEFRGRSWMPVEPKHLDYPNAQILLIGESFDDSHALDATTKDQKSEQTETPQEELEKLEGEDELRVKNLRGDDTVFNDLGISHKEYSSVPTTW